MVDGSGSPTAVRIDLGCGNAKRPGFLGLDMFDGEHVDYVLDLTSDHYPFADGTVDEVFSAHFLEHIEEPNHVFSEVGRVCADGAQIQFWTPYAWTNEAFLYGHLHAVTEDLWSQFCIYHRDVFADMLRGRWLLKRVVYVVDESTIVDLRHHGVDLDFAIRYYKGVVKEMGVEIEFRRDLATPAVMPERFWASTRDGARNPLRPGTRTASASKLDLVGVARRVKRFASSLRA